MDAFVVAGLVFVAVSALQILAAYGLWNARLDGPVLELILLGLSACFGSVSSCRWAALRNACYWRSCGARRADTSLVHVFRPQGRHSR